MKSSSDDRELLQKMKNLLLSGARMLDEVCPNCGTPLFYIKEVGLKYCPKCDVYVATPQEIENAKIDKSRLKIISIDELKREKSEIKELPKNKQRNSEIKSINKRVLDTLNELILVIVEKLILLIEKNYDKMNVNSLLATLEHALRILKEIKKLEEEPDNA